MKPKGGLSACLVKNAHNVGDIRRWAATVLLVQFNDGHWVAPEVTTNQDNPTWEEILAAHGQMAVLTAWRILGRTQDTEDVVQESWIECLRLRSSCDIQDWGGVIRVITRAEPLIIFANDPGKKQSSSVPN